MAVNAATEPINPITDQPYSKGYEPGAESGAASTDEFVSEVIRATSAGQRLQALQLQLKAIGADYWINPYTAIYTTAWAVAVLEQRLRQALGHDSPLLGIYRSKRQSGYPAQEALRLAKAVMLAEAEGWRAILVCQSQLSEAEKRQLGQRRMLGVGVAR